MHVYRNVHIYIKSCGATIDITSYIVANMKEKKRSASFNRSISAHKLQLFCISNS